MRQFIGSAEGLWICMVVHLVHYDSCSDIDKLIPVIDAEGLMGHVELQGPEGIACSPIGQSAFK